MVDGSKVNDPVGGTGHKACVGLPDSTSAVVGVEVGFNNLAYSSAKSTTDCSKVLLAEAT